MSNDWRQKSSCKIRRHLQNVELLADDSDDGSEAVVLDGGDAESPAGAVPLGLVSLLLGGGRAATAEADGNAEDADAAAARGGLLETGVDGGRN